MTVHGYAADVQRLSWELGGGYVAFAPALMGCVADGATRREALKDLGDAIDCWLEIAAKQRRSIPQPDGDPEAP